MMRPLLLLTAVAAVVAAGAPPDYARRVNEVKRTPGFVALWDFVKRDSSGAFVAHVPPGASKDFRLDPVNYVREYWNEGRAATLDDFPLLGRGPFGNAVQFRKETDPAFRPCLMVPRARLHNSRLDVHGPNRSVSMVVWLVRESGNHAIAGIWHEGTDHVNAAGSVAARVEKGQRQYALFAGLAANDGASAAHVSENGARSFGDRYARNIAVTPEKIPAVPADAPPAQLDAAWTAVGFVFDNKRNTVTAYLNGVATDYWIDNPQQHPFFKWPAEGWRSGEYTPPEGKPISRTEVQRSDDGTRVELWLYKFTKVRVTLDRQGKVLRRELASLRVNPYWFGHDLYTPASEAEGGPFTIGRVIHMSRSVGFTGWIGGVAVFDRALSPQDMKRVSAAGRDVR